jgi:hypothetical protein
MSFRLICFRKRGLQFGLGTKKGSGFQAIDPEPTLVGDGHNGTEVFPICFGGSSESSLAISESLIEPAFEEDILFEHQRGRLKCPRIS